MQPSRPAGVAGYICLPRVFELHARTDRPRCYEWREIEEFLVVESRDDEDGVVLDVGFRYSPEHRRTVAPSPTGSDTCWPQGDVTGRNRMARSTDTGIVPSMRWSTQ